MRRASSFEQVPAVLLAQRRRGWAWAGIGLVVLGLGACDRRPGDPPKPSTLASATPATAGIAGLSGQPDRGTAAISPASDPPPSPIPQPAQPPSTPASS